ncbi:MAG: FlgD immunoglobulin-like domain containing protein [bacterium]|jgi:hypothetical protein
MKSTVLTFCLMVALVALSGAGAPSLALDNLLANPGFDANGGSYDGWFTFGDGVQLSTTETDNIIRSGAAASKIYGEFTDCPGSNFYKVGGYGQAFTPTPGMVYRFSGYSYVSSSDAIPGTDTCNKNRCIAKVVFWNADSAGTEISSSEVVIGDGNSITDQWNEFTVSAPAPVGALRVEALVLFLQPECDTGSVFIDDTRFFELSPTAEPNLLANPNFDGGLTGWNTFSNVYYDARNWAVRTPMGSAKMFSSFDDSSDTGMFQTFAATAGLCYQLDVHTLNTCREDPIYGTNDNFAIAQILFVDVNGDSIGGDQIVIADNTSPLGKWTKTTLIAGAPAGTDSVHAFFLFISPTLQNGAFWFDDASFRELPGAGVPVKPNPVGATLYQNAPNPFSPTTKIRFDLARAGHVKICVYNVKGELVSTLVDGEMAQGLQEVSWTAMDDNGEEAASGIYFYRLVTEDSVQTMKMMLLH